MEQQVIAPTDKHREQAREILRQWADEMSNVSWWISFDVLTIRNLPHELDASKLIERIAAALSSRDTEVREAQSEDIRAAAKEIARFIESTTTLAVGQPMINAIETIIHETCFCAVPAAPQVDDEQ